MTFEIPVCATKEHKSTKRLFCGKRSFKHFECRKDVGVLDEIPGAYKSIEAVMKNQEDLVEVVAEIKQVVCVKG
ncbi:MAG TPA: RtcB family protein [Pyrinomonadaceae bacterium]|nr:RtcB family protein [Pyrinomonadaceae bacterium]